MTFKKVLLITFLEWLFLALAKIVYFQDTIFSGGVSQYAYWGVILIITTFLVRRLGVLNFLEAGSIAVFWFLAFLFLDFILVSGYLGMGIFSQGAFWVGHMVMMFSVFFFHHKRHIQIRKQHQAHGHH
jgi:hypothetical protein